MIGYTLYPMMLTNRLHIATRKKCVMKFWISWRATKKGCTVMYRIIVIDEENEVVELNNLVQDIYLVTTNEQRWPTQYILRSEDNENEESIAKSP